MKKLDQLSSLLESPRARRAWFALVLVLALVVFLRPRSETHTFFPATEAVLVSSEPPGASIFIEGIEIGKVTPAILDLRPEQLDQVKVRLEGFVADPVEVISEDDHQELHFRFHL